MAVAVQHHRFTVDDYERLIGSGVFTDNDRVELIDGEILDMSPMGFRHAAAVNRLIQLLAQRIGDQAFLTTQTPVRIGLRDEPEPDAGVARLRADRYRSGLPTAADLLLVIEVADTSYEFDRGAKLAVYARAQVPEYWIVDLDRERVEVHREPVGDAYASIRLMGLDDELRVPGCAARLRVGEIIGD